jgi:glycosyl transferase family 2
VLGIPPSWTHLVTDPRVTVLLSAHNAEATLPATLESVRRQTFPDLELLVIDDGSTDGTRGLLRQWPDPRLRVIEQERTGLTRALARGVAEARGVYVARLDADDVAANDRLERQVALLDADPNLVLIGSWADIVDERGRLLERARPPVDDAAIRTQLLWDNAFFHSAMTLRREAVLEAGNYDPAVAHAQDYELAWRLSRLGSLQNVPAGLLRWRRAAGSISAVHRDEQRRSAGRTALRALAETLAQPPPEEWYWRARDVWDGRADRLPRGDGVHLARLVEQLPPDAARTVWIDLVVTVAAAVPTDALALLTVTWRHFPGARARLLAVDHLARVAFGPRGLRATRALRRRVRGY